MGTQGTEQPGGLPGLGGVGHTGSRDRGSRKTGLFSDAVIHVPDQISRDTLDQNREISYIAGQDRAGAAVICIHGEGVQLGSIETCELGRSLSIFGRERVGREGDVVDVTFQEVSILPKADILPPEDESAPEV